MRDTLLADRIRAAACIALRQERGPLRIAELVDAIERMGIPIPAPANKTVSDLLRCEVRRHHVRRYGRGRYLIDRLPRATEYGMRQRIASYQAGVTVQPHRHVPMTSEEAAAIQRRRSQTGAAL